MTQKLGDSCSKCVGVGVCIGERKVEPELPKGGHEQGRALTFHLKTSAIAGRLNAKAYVGSFLLFPS